MAIYKLGEILSDKPIYGVNSSSLKIGQYKYFIQSDIEKKQFSKFTNISKNKFMEKNDFFISRAGTIKTYLHSKEEKWVYGGYIVKYPLNLDICIPKYIDVWFHSKNGRRNLEIFSKGGSTMPKLNPNNAKDIPIEVPTINLQKKIIDIIEPNEKLFLKYHENVRIDKPENTKKDIKNLIDIIEPIERALSKIKEIKKIIIELLIKNYSINNKSKINLLEICSLNTCKYEKQKNYFATNAIGEMAIDYSKTIILKNKELTRANLTPIDNSFIVAKLIGENKIFYFSKKPNEVFSTGFFNFKTNFNDHFLAFLLSEEFKKQKIKLASGTTMKALNNDTISKIKIKSPINKSDKLTLSLEILIQMSSKIDELKKKMIMVLIK